MKSLEQSLSNAQRVKQAIKSTSCDEPENLTQAYHIQRTIFERNNKGLGAWKLGRLADNSVFCAPVYAADIFQQGDKLPPNYQHACHVEAEVAFKLSRQICPADEVTLANIGDYFSQVCCAIEVLDSRFSDWQSASSFAHIADRQMNGALALGEPHMLTSLENYRHQSFSLHINDELISSGENQHPEADLAQVLWGFVKRAQLCGYLLQSDSWVTTGTWSGYPKAEVGDKIEVSFSRLGKLLITL